MSQRKKTSDEIIRLRVAGLDEKDLQEALNSIGEIEKSITPENRYLATDKPEFTVKVKKSQVGDLLIRGKGLAATRCKG